MVAEVGPTGGKSSYQRDQPNTVVHAWEGGVAPVGGMATEANCEWSSILPEWSGQWGLGAPSLRGRGFDPLGGAPANVILRADAGGRNPATKIL